MCDIWKRETNDQMRAQDLERHRASLETLGVRQVVLTGGEPLTAQRSRRSLRLLSRTADSSYTAHHRSSPAQTRRRGRHPLRRRHRLPRRPSRDSRRHSTRQRSLQSHLTRVSSPSVTTILPSRSPAAQPSRKPTTVICARQSMPQERSASTPSPSSQPTLPHRRSTARSYGPAKSRAKSA